MVAVSNSCLKYDLSYFLKECYCFVINTVTVFFSSGIPAVVVGLVAVIRPVSFDMSKPLTVDVTCGSLHLTARAERNRCGHNLNTVKSPMLCIGKFTKNCYSNEYFPYNYFYCFSRPSTEL